MNDYKKEEEKSIKNGFDSNLSIQTHSRKSHQLEFPMFHPLENPFLISSNDNLEKKKKEEKKKERKLTKEEDDKWGMC